MTHPNASKLNTGNEPRIKLRHSHTKTGVRVQCSAVEDIDALARNPNSWMFDREIDECKNFKGTEAEAVALRTKLEKACSDRLGGWEMYQ
jgi:hypothetical protein